MKATLLTLIAVLLAGCEDKSDTSLVADEDAIDVFQRAFWKRPTSNDKILHAERREWTDEFGMVQWQWFLIVQPSMELVKHLRDDNAFGLVTTDTSPNPKNAPGWFQCPTEGVDVLHAPRGNTHLVFSRNTNLLHAYDAGSGFHPGRPVPEIPQASERASVGRLPSTPPPLSSQ